MTERITESDLQRLLAERDQTFLRRVFVEGRGRVIGRPAYRAFTRIELAAERAMDGLLPPDFGDQDLVNRRLTAVVKTFERPDDLQRLLASIRRFYPDLSLIVVDDSRQPREIPGVQTIAMPFDSGISAGRNEGVRHVTTPYFILLDDDFVFYRHTDLPAALALMEAEPKIDIMGGKVVNLPFYKVTDYREAALFPTAAQPTMAPGSTLAGLPVYDIVPNFFIARTERLRQVMWDERFRRLEHGDFFTRARGVLTSVYNERMRCLHVRTLFDEGYLVHRHDLAQSREHLLTRYFGFSQAADQGREGEGGPEDG